MCSGVRGVGTATPAPSGARARTVAGVVLSLALLVPGRALAEPGAEPGAGSSDAGSSDAGSSDADGTTGPEAAEDAAAGSDPVTARPPEGTEAAALFDSRGRLLSQSTPAYVYVGSPLADEYARVEVELSGNVRVQRWRASRWE